ncbi:unnamed protein product [Aspergillus oryzae var. brunneus]|uniref:Unnamed protein product n=2 Tax=Aspergillus oryzae TaxID=5062 RepID=A0AAN5C2T6_ASPOZ|nr:unnamed protein product [Aspergillus oryzae]GMG35486.1 unnamed protein product [Aspergillus oryzae]GMG44617.1 unnamed protein product [Aspergillus oryzae var. brunneus]
MPSGPEVRGKFHWKRSTELEFGDLEEGEEYLSRPGFHEGNQGLGAFQSVDPKPARAPRTGAIVSRAFFKGIMWLNGLEKLLAVLPQLAAATSCFQRIHEYITSDPVKDGRLGHNKALMLNSAISPANADEKEFAPRTDDEEQGVAIKLDNVTVLPSPKAIPVALKNVSFKVTRALLPTSMLCPRFLTLDIFLAQLLKVADSVISLSADGQVELQTTGRDAIPYAAIPHGREDTDAREGGLNEKTWDKAADSSDDPVNEVKDEDRASKWTEAGGGQLSLYLSVYITLALAASMLVLGCIWIIFLELMPKSAIRLHWRLLNAVIRAPLSFFSTTDSGMTLNRFSQDMTLVDLALPISLMSLGQSFFECIATVGLIATGSAYMALAVGLHESTNAGLLGVALNNILGFNQLLSLFITSWTTFETSLGVIARVKSFVETTPSEFRDGEIPESPVSWPEEGAIHIQGLSLSYPNGTPMLHDISICIEPGERIGICGRTGSSLILSLLRLINPSHGSITIDGINIESISPSAIREALITVPQDPFTFLGTMRYNADIMGASNDEEIISALKQVGIWEAIESRGGLDAILEDHPLF